MNKKTLGVVCSIVAIGVLSSFSVVGQAADKLFQNKTSTPEEIQALYKSINLIVTEDGEFVRVDKAPSVPKEAIVTDHKDTNEDTKVLMLDYGIFVKK